MSHNARRALEWYSQVERPTIEVYEALAIAIKALVAGQETLASMGYSYPEAEDALRTLALRDGRGGGEEWL